MNHAASKDLNQAFRKQIDEIVSACTACGACYEVCPITTAAGVGGLDGESVTQSIRLLLQYVSPESTDAETWASSCILSGDCIDACRHGVNPRLMLALARMATSEKDMAAKAREDAGKEAFKNLGTGVKTLSQIQLSKTDLARLGQGNLAEAEDTPDYVFYTGCNVLKTPHIALLCLDIMDVLGIKYRSMGGPAHCCGIMQYRAGDIGTSLKVASNSIQKFKKTGASTILSWCPTCQVQYGEIALPTYRKATQSNPFEMTPFVLFLANKIDELRPYLSRPIDRRVALHLHPGIRGLPEAARKILAAVPGVEVVDLGLPEIGLMSNSLGTIPAHKRDLQAAELDAAEAAGVDALAAVYHADHRELCAHESERPFKIINFLEIVAASIGIIRTDTFKALKKKQDVDAIIEDCAKMIREHGLEPDRARPVIKKALLGEQPLPLRNAKKASESV